MMFEGLFKAERDGKFRFYSIADERFKRLLETIQKEYCKS
jgi:hypothetical protein